MTPTDRVFVVDGDPSARGGLIRLLSKAGYQARGFASAREFLDTSDPGTSGCLVLDLSMPGMSWEGLLAELEALGVHLPIIVVTADDDAGTRLKARKLKAVGLFRKPVDGLALLDAVGWALEQGDGSSEGGIPR